jgi:type I restriction enzyme M protein
MNITNLSSLIWSAADDVLRIDFKPHEYGSVILPFVVLRRLDCVLEPKKDEIFELYEKYKNQLDPTPIIQKQVGLPYFNYSKYDLSRLKSDPNNLLLNFNNYIQGYSENILDIMKNFKLAPVIEKLHEKNSLYLLINKFTEFDLHPSKVDNHMMGSIYEELLRKFSEMSNEESGDHFTPRDIVKLLVTIVFGGDRKNLEGQGKIRSIYDPCCGTGGMLTIGKEWVLENVNKNLKINLYGQEANDETYSICKSDLLMMGEDAENIGRLSTLSTDRHVGKKFDYMLSNPPYGVSWKKDAEFVENEAKDPNGRFFAGLPRISDGSFLFLQHLVDKMNPKGSRIGIIFNASPLYNGDAGQGESEIRRWVIENDLLESIIMLPDKLFFNTGITTYLWILSNNKEEKRRNKIQLIDASSFFKFIKKKLGEKNKEIDSDQITEIFNLYNNFVENEYSLIFDNNYFGYTKVTIEQPLIENGQVIKNKNGTIKPDSKKRDYERIPFFKDIDKYFNEEVIPHLPNAWMDRSKDKIGYELSLTKHFYKFNKSINPLEIKNKITALETEISNLINKI